MNKVNLTETQELLIQGRYIPLVRHLKRRARMTAAMFHTARTIITVGSLIVPALLSIQYTEGIAVTNPTYTIYWATWVISLFVTMCNGLVALFKLDKRYYFLHTTLEHLTSEGWQYLALTGKYSGYHTPGLTPTHDNQFLYFCHAVEKIRMHQVEEEYYKLSEQTSQQQQAGAAAKAAALLNDGASKSAPTVRVPPTPMNQELQKLIGPQMAKLLMEQLSKLTAEDASSAEHAAGGSSKKEAEEKNEVVESHATATATPRSPDTQNGTPRPLSVSAELPV